MAIGTPYVGGDFRLKVDGSTALSVRDFSWNIEKPTFEITSLDSSGTREHISSKMAGSTIDFNAGIVNPFPAPAGQTFDILLYDLLYANKTTTWDILPVDVSGYKWSGTGFITKLNPSYSNFGEGALTYSGSIQVTGKPTRTTV